MTKYLFQESFFFRRIRPSPPSSSSSRLLCQQCATFAQNRTKNETIMNLFCARLCKVSKTTAAIIIIKYLVRRMAMTQTTQATTTNIAIVQCILLSISTFAQLIELIDGTWFGMLCALNMQTASIALWAHAKLGTEPSCQTVASHPNCYVLILWIFLIASCERCDVYMKLKKKKVKVPPAAVAMGPERKTPHHYVM